AASIIEEDRKLDFTKDENEERGNWSGKADFLLACLGYAVGLGNVWRFPYLCYRNGGAVFFIPYCIMLFLVGMPIFFLELSLGQFTSSGPLTCWKFAPMFTGLGVGMVIVSALVAIYYNMIIAWSLYYLFASIISIPTGTLPWAGAGGCGNWWNSDFCAETLTNLTSHNCSAMSLTESANGVCYNGSVVAGIWNYTRAKENNISPRPAAEEYLYGRVWRLYQSTGLDNLGELHWDLAVSLLGAWVIVALSLIKGIKSSGKVVYFTALFPYVVLVILFVRGLLLDGHREGIEFYIMQANLTKLTEAAVWKDAAVQIFFSLSASWGGLITLSSYNRFHNNCLRDSLIVSIGNCLTSFFAGFVIFSYLGFLARELNLPVSEVADGGIGLAFVVYPRAVATIGASHFWSIIFFIMLITLGLDSEFALVETVTTSIMDVWTSTRKHKWAVVTCVSIILYLLGLVMCTSGGAYLLQLADEYSGGWNVLLIAFSECIAIGLVYGVKRFRDDIYVMVGEMPCFPWMCSWWWWAVNWCFFTPLLVAFIMIFSWINYKPLSFGTYEYPVWGLALGWLMTMAVVVGIFIPYIYLLIVTPGGLWTRIVTLASPSVEWGPALPKHRRLAARFHRAMIIDPWDTGVMGNGLEVKVDPGPGVPNPAYEDDRL
ncbi:sodium- and chloride-dependent neutral and basic amino acid transporter B(0+)-like, partial [Lingula anatina]|uniref:Transporter n=1 Tax=Lingula anatina TaxID=7574 RepID=A0A1S3K1M1_LINAN